MFLLYLVKQRFISQPQLLKIKRYLGARQKTPLILRRSDQTIPVIGFHFFSNFIFANLLLRNININELIIGNKYFKLLKIGRWGRHPSKKLKMTQKRFKEKITIFKIKLSAAKLIDKNINFLKFCSQYTKLLYILYSGFQIFENQGKLSLIYECITYTTTKNNSMKRKYFCATISLSIDVKVD